MRCLAVGKLSLLQACLGARALPRAVWHEWLVQAAPASMEASMRLAQPACARAEDAHGRCSTSGSVPAPVHKRGRGDAGRGQRVQHAQHAARAARTMPARVQKEAEAMWGTMTALSHSARPGFILGSSSNTSRPTLAQAGRGWDPRCSGWWTLHAGCADLPCTAALCSALL